MKYKITAPLKVSTTIKLPSSKSISNRALIINALADGDGEINNLSNCDDTNVMIEAFNSDSNIIDVKAAGTSMRFLTGFLSKTPGDWIITGSQRMLQRPIRILVEALNSLGARIRYVDKEGFPPLSIRGSALEGGEIELSGSISSQFISSLLMIAPTMEKGLTVRLKDDVISIPYIKMTLKMMADFGVKTTWDDRTIRIYPQDYKAIPYTIESDWSAASYWYEIVALSDSADVKLLGLNKDSAQGDSRVADLFLDLGVETEYLEDGVVLKKTNRIVKKMFHNFINEPDLAQTFAVTCCLMNIPFLFTGLQSLKIKETDRIEALKNELKKLGYILTDRENSILEWNGERCVADEQPTIATYEDHRMAMAFAPAAFKIDNLLIAEPHVVSKSYPDFWNDLRNISFGVAETE